MTNPTYEDDVRDYSTRRAAADSDDREISLGIPTILGLFFALALALAAVFGLGYTLGRRSAQPPAVFADPSLAVSTGSPKPSAGTSDAPALPPPDTSAQPAVETQTVPLTPTSATTPAPPAQSAPAVPPAAAPTPAAAAPQPTTNNQQPAAAFYVQVAAVSSQDVADILTSSLQKKGYTVQVRPGTQDKLLHVQMGPYSDKKEAEAMRQRVLADGFNAIVK